MVKKRPVPFVVCWRLVSSITSKVVPNSRFSRVPRVSKLMSTLSNQTNIQDLYSLFPVDCEPKTATMSYENPLSRNPHRSICAPKSGLREDSLQNPSQDNRYQLGTYVNLFSSSTIWILSDREWFPFSCGLAWPLTWLWFSAIC